MAATVTPECELRVEIGNVRTACAACAVMISEYKLGFAGIATHQSLSLVRA